MEKLQLTLRKKIINLKSTNIPNLIDEMLYDYQIGNSKDKFTLNKTLREDWKSISPSIK